jgi:hypothetical protein
VRDTTGVMASAEGDDWAGGAVPLAFRAVGREGALPQLGYACRVPAQPPPPPPSTPTAHGWRCEEGRQGCLRRLGRGWRRARRRGAHGRGGNHLCRVVVFNHDDIRRSSGIHRPRKVPLHRALGVATRRRKQRGGGAVGQPRDVHHHTQRRGARHSLQGWQGRRVCGQSKRPLRSDTRTQMTSDLPIGTAKDDGLTGMNVCEPTRRESACRQSR